MTGSLFFGLALLIGLACGWIVALLAGRYESEGVAARWPSRCSTCKAAFRWFETIPILFLLAFRGRCRQCGTRTSWTSVIVQAAVVLVWIVIASVMGPTLRTLMGGLLGSILVGIAVVNARTLLIPDVFTLGGLGIAAIYGLAHGYRGFLLALLGAAVGLGLTFAVGLLGRMVFREETLGGGIIKMCAMIGAFVGWKGVLVTICLSVLLAAPVFGLTSLKRKRLVPFGVFLAVATSVVFVWGDAIIEWYRRFLNGG